MLQSESFELFSLRYEVTEANFDRLCADFTCMGVVRYR